MAPVCIIFKCENRIIAASFGPFLTQDKQQTVLRFLYAKFKYVHRLMSHTSELLRICSSYHQRSKGIGWLVAVEDKEPTDQPNMEPNATLIYRIDQSLLHSSQLVLERRTLEAQTTTPEYFASCVDRILKKKLFAPYSPQSRLLKSSLAIISSTFILMHELNARAATAYDRENSQHEKQLLQFWDLAMPNEALTKRVGKQWEKIGFQGHDPATDFRGMGCLGLDDLFYYAKYHPMSFQRVLKSSHHDTAWFSMAIVGINITGFTLSLLRKRYLQPFFYKYGVSKDVYHEFYCYVFNAFEIKWTAGNSFLTVMDFGKFFEEFQKEIERELERVLSVTMVLDEGRHVFNNDKRVGK
ncbi:UNVERIFIED_CONTAM: ELMO domain-containing protein 2 [Siphonaria sp. JEL0065]|nr:ELMO domain-containing protein 2 [Siphonaria sp. JEL0065]